MTSSDTAAPRIRLDQRGHVAWLTIDNVASANALTLDMIGQLDDYWRLISDSDHLRAAVLEAAGDRHFCAGVDRSALSGRLPVAPDGVRHNRTALTAGVTKPVITVVTGAAIGLGMNLALDADLVVATESAYFADPRLAYNLLPNAPIVFARDAPFGEMARVGLTGQRLTARRAYELGLVTELSGTAAEARAGAAACAAAIAERDPSIVAESLRLMRSMRRDGHFHAVMADVDTVTLAAEERRSEANARAAAGSRAAAAAGGVAP